MTLKYKKLTSTRLVLVTEETKGKHTRLKVKIGREYSKLGSLVTAYGYTIVDFN